MELEDKFKSLSGQWDDSTLPESATPAFSKRLQEELHLEKRNKKASQLFYWIAGCAAVFAVVFSVIDLPANREKEAFNQMVTSLSQTTLATEQLETIDALRSGFTVKDDSRFVHALIDIVQAENSANVKVTAIETLVNNYADKEIVRTGLVQALEQETEPLVQIKLIKTLTFLKESRAQQPLEQIIANRENVSAVRSSAQLAMTNFKNQ